MLKENRFFFNNNHELKRYLFTNKLQIPMRSNEINVELYLKYGSPTLSIVNDDVRGQEIDDYNPIIVVAGAGALAAGIAFFIVQKKNLKHKTNL